MARLAQRGEIWMIDLGLAAKARPCLVLSIEFRDDERAVVTYVARTTSLRGGRFEVEHKAPRFLPGAFDDVGSSPAPQLIPEGGCRVRADIDRLQLVAIQGRTHVHAVQSVPQVIDHGAVRPSPAFHSSGPRDFYQNVASFDQRTCGGEMGGKDLLQLCLAGIAAGEPDDLWRRAEAELQFNEVAILGNDDSTGFGCLMVNRLIVCIPQSQVANGNCVDVKLTGKPARKTRRELGIQPDGHAASTGWSTNRLAYATQARMSSASRSGISSRIWAGVRPETNRSSTSVTRILIPRTQGLPPHWSSRVVMRFKRSDMRSVSVLALVSATRFSNVARNGHVNLAVRPGNLS